MRRLALILMAAVAAAQVYQAGPQALTFFSDVDDSDQPYAIYVPHDFDASQKYPLVISLHGAGSNHRLNLRRVFGVGNLAGETDPEATRYFPRFKDVPYIVASPYARGTMGYQGIPEKDVYDVLADVKKRFPIDDDRVYLTGLSMGGGGTLWLGLTRPDVWAALAPVCPAAPASAEELAGNALNLPVKIFQGEADPVVKAEETREWQKRLTDAAVKSEYVEYPGIRHNAWDRAYKDAEIFDWFSHYRRNLHPLEVRYATREYDHTSAYWVSIDGLTPGELASVDARFTRRNTITVTTSGVLGLSLLLKGHPSFATGQPVSVTLDGKTIQARIADRMSFVRSGTESWTRGRYRYGRNEKRPGVSGPIGQAIASRHIYVYGTAGGPTTEELKLRHEQAQRAAEWSSSRSRLLINFRVLADEEVRESDLRDANLVLFGNRETNNLIARLMLQMPVELNSGAADFGLVMAVPFSDRLAIVNSGLPWWTRADQARRSGLPFIPVPFRALQSLDDFILFKGGLDDVVAEGRFDRNWRLPPAAAARMKATGAVTLH